MLKRFETLVLVLLGLLVLFLPVPRCGGGGGGEDPAPDAVESRATITAAELAAFEVRADVD